MRIVAIRRRLAFNTRLVYGTFCYNSCNGPGYAFETLTEPLFCLVENFAKSAGPAFVTIVILLKMFVVITFYTSVLPYRFSSSSTAFCVPYLLYGHWLLVNIVFHYWMAVRTMPGTPPPIVPEVVSICRSCVSPKPPRAHHCGICRCCVLKMDHHCPWLNNCVGHYNHRYFFLFMVYMWLGCVFICFSSYEQFHARLFFPAGHSSSSSIHQWLGHILTGNATTDGNSVLPAINTTDSHAPIVVAKTSIGVVLLFLLCLGVTISLGCLIAYHAYLIGRAETSIEKHINASEAQRLAKEGKPYRNVYNSGWLSNWKIFLGLEHDRSFWQHVLLPSRHTPIGDGLVWSVKYD